VSDLHKIIDLGPTTDNSIVQGTPVYATIGTDLNIIMEDHPAQLWNPLKTRWRWMKAKACPSDTSTRMYRHSVTNKSMAYNYTGVNITIRAYFYI
jgi:hypothetical protein